MLEDFFKVILELKNIQRKGWVDKLNIENPESVADHSYSMTFMSMILSEIQGLDTNKIVKMSLLHDLAESKMGDFTPDDIPRERKLELENNEMQKLLKKLPEKLVEDYQNVWNEFTSCKSQEAIFVHEMDKLEMIFQAKNYFDRGIPKEKIQTFIDTATNGIKNKDLKEILSKIF